MVGKNWEFMMVEYPCIVGRHSNSSIEVGGSTSEEQSATNWEKRSDTESND